MPSRPSSRFDWAEAALKLGDAIPRGRLEPAVLRWMDASSARSVWSVALSGGADSLALLLLLWAHWPRRRSRLQALHFDHRLRGAESRGDAEFSRRVCAALRVKFVTAKWRGAQRDASEADARAARMQFLASKGRSIFFGHQEDDIAETMLMRLARGSGSGGLAAPRPVHKLPRGLVHLRPLLRLKKAEIIAVLCQLDIPWREDATNAGEDFLRNRIRRRVVPAWIDAVQRDALAGAARSRSLLEEDDAAIERWVEEVKPLDRRGRLVMSVLAGKPRGFLRRALHQWVAAEPRVGEISRQAFDALLDDIERGRATRHSVGSAGFAVIDAEFVRFERSGNGRRTFRRRAN